VYPAGGLGPIRRGRRHAALRQHRRGYEHPIAIDYALPTATEDYNLFFCSGGFVGEVSSGGNSVLGDPLFVDPAADDYRLASGLSPAVDAGLDLGVSTDLPGDPRPQPPGGGFDLGAYESPYTPLPWTAAMPGCRAARSTPAPTPPPSRTPRMTPPGDLVQVAGYCLGVHSTEGSLLTLLVEKALTVQGGYTVTNGWPGPIPTSIHHPGRRALRNGRRIPLRRPLRLANLDIVNGYVDQGEFAGGVTATGPVTVDRVNFLNNSGPEGGGLLGGTTSRWWTACSRTTRATTAAGWRRGRRKSRFTVPWR